MAQAKEGSINPVSPRKDEATLGLRQPDPELREMLSIFDFSQLRTEKCATFFREWLSRDPEETSPCPP